MTKNFQNKSETFLRFMVLVFGIFQAMSFLQACMITPAGGTYSLEARAEPVHVPRLEGEWAFNITGPGYASTGRLELSWIRGGWAGRIWFQTIQQWEELRDVFFDPRTGRLEFFRPSYNQRFSGTLSDNQLFGTLNGYTMEGRRERVHVPRLEGGWVFNITSTGYASTGRLEFSSIRGGWTGRIWFQTTQQWEELRDIFFDARDGRLEFFRPSYNQRFSGTLSDNQLLGTLNGYTIEGRPYR